MSDKVAIEFLQAAGGDMKAALLRMASTIEKARMRHDEITGGRRGMVEGLNLMGEDLQPNRRRVEP